MRYGDIEEDHPPGMTEPLGNIAQAAFYIGVNHAGNFLLGVHTQVS